MDKSVKAAFRSRIPDEPKAAKIASISIDRDDFRLMVAAFLEAEAERVKARPAYSMAAIQCDRIIVDYANERAAELRGGK